MIVLYLIPFFSYCQGSSILSFTTNQVNLLLSIHFQSPSRSTCANGDSISRVNVKDTKQKIRRLDSVFHHLALDEVMVPWASDGESSSSDDQSSGFAVSYGGNTPDPVEEEKFSLDNVDFRFEEDYVNSVDLPPRLLPVFHPQETIKGYVYIILKGVST